MKNTRRNSLILLVLVSLFCLGGCSNGNVVIGAMESVQSIGVDTAEGSFYYDLGEEFSEDYYDVNELKEMAQAEVDEYNKSHNETVLLKECKTSVSGGTTYVNLTYAMANDHTVADFSGDTFFYGTVAEAMATGMSIRSFSLVSVKDNSAATGLDIMSKYPDKHVIITSLKGSISCDQKAMYVSKDCYFHETAENGYYTDTTNAEAELVMIVLKK